MEPDAKTSAPLSDVHSDFDIVDNDGLEGDFERGGPVQSASDAASEQDFDHSKLPAAPQELTTLRTTSDVVARVLPTCNEQDKKSVQEGDDQRSPTTSQTSLAESEGDEQRSTLTSSVRDFHVFTEVFDRPVRKRKVQERYEGNIDSSAPLRTKANRQASTNDPSPSSKHRQDPPLEAEASKNKLECEAELTSTREQIMDAENTVESRAPRSRRHRKAPQSYNEAGSDDGFVAEAPAQAKRTSSGCEKPKRVAPTWTPDFLLQDPKSRLGKVNLTAILKDPRAWESLSKEQQVQLINLLPNVPSLDLDPANVDGECLFKIVHEFLNNSALLSDIAMFGEDLREGRLDHDWQHEGQAAMEMRARGEFDDWKVQEMEAFWGQKQKLQYDVLAGESSKIKLDELVRKGTIQVGDVWVYKRNFPKDGAVVDKEAKVISITEDHKLVFSFPPGTAKFSSTSAGQDLVTDPLSTPQQLGDAIIREDGRVSTYRNHNAWKEFRVFRNKNDIGHLWERRELYWAKKSEGGQFK